MGAGDTNRQYGRLGFHCEIDHAQHSFLHRMVGASGALWEDHHSPVALKILHQYAHGVNPGG